MPGLSVCVAESDLPGAVFGTPPSRKSQSGSGLFLSPQASPLAKASSLEWSPSTLMSWRPPPSLVEFLSVSSTTPASIVFGPVMVAFLPAGLSSNAALVGSEELPLSSSSSPHAANAVLAATTARAVSVLRFLIQFPCLECESRTRTP